MQSLIYKVEESTFIADVGLDPSSIGQSDLLMIGILDTSPDAAISIPPTYQTYGFWINKGRLVPFNHSSSSFSFESLPNLPKSPFPFTRMAALSPTNGTSFFIYHQLNASSFVEDQWDSSVGGWISNSIAISMD